MTPDLTVDLCGVRLRNPLVLASGVLGTDSTLLHRVARTGLGAVTAKSCSLEPRAGHPNPTVLDWGPGIINAVGLANPGVERQLDILQRSRELLAPYGVAIFASIVGNTVDDFARVAERVSQAQPDLIEVNISCPNVISEFGELFSTRPESAAAVTRAVKGATAIPVSVKISPNVSDIVSVARAVAEAGANAITAINTVGPGMVIDVESGRPVLSNNEGGLSGPAIRPIAIRCVYQIARAVQIPIIGTGGVTRGRDVVEMLMAGATAVGVGSAVYWGGPEVFSDLTGELNDFMAAHGYDSLESIRGVATR
ncbi:MAG: dihydroorotate dehydrogenase [Chloroflexi bacterium]|nr:dihydroorotate dehydrogenase [Chloroflexota bacterium]